MTPFEPTQRLVVELEAQEWNMVLGGLAELQRNVSVVSGKIARQAQQAAQQPASPPLPERPVQRFDNNVEQRQQGA
jgi:hypothetical protein